MTKHLNLIPGAPLLIVIVGMSSPGGIDLMAVLLQIGLAVVTLIGLIWFLSCRHRTSICRFAASGSANRVWRRSGRWRRA